MDWLATWARYNRIGFWTAEELDRLEAKFSKRHAKLVGVPRQVAVVALVTRSLGELLIEKGIITKEELIAQIERVDHEDGSDDGTLDPELVVPGSKKARKPESPAPKASAEIVARANERIDSLRKKKKGSSS